MSWERSGLPELLAPAGSMDSLVAAVNAGADAVYLGGKRFGARRYSPNFTDAELSAGIAYAHLRGAKVYVTVNTLLHDRELPEVARYLVDLYAMGVDAVLIQDPGVARIAREVVPDLPRHASTQCTVAGTEGVVHAKESGYDRVVLAREASLDEIDRIFCLPEEKRPGIEIFAHGALCYAYSGQCLLSSVIGGRSGNRGACAQPCRREYALVRGGSDSYGRLSSPREVALRESCLLSTRDLCLYPHLETILKRPFAALKIEGRMRSPEYVAVVVAIYRAALDRAAAGSFSPARSDMEDLAIAYSRGFTPGYLLGARGPALMGRDRPDNRGLFIGTVRSCGRGGMRVSAETPRPLLPGDGLVLIDPAGRAQTGLVLRDTPDRAGRELVIRQVAACSPGTALFLTRSVSLERMAASIRSAPGPAGRFPVPIDIAMEILPGEPPLLAGWFELAGQAPVAFETVADFVTENADGRPTTGEEIARQVGRSGGTGFSVRTLRIRYGGGLFLPIGHLNRFRRRFFDDAKKALLARYLPGDLEEEAARGRVASVLPVISRRRGRGARSPGIGVLCNEIGAVRAACLGVCESVYFEPGPGRMERELREALAICSTAGVKCVWKWPRIPVPEFTREALALLPGLESAGLREVMVEGVMYAAPVHSAAPGIRVTGGPDLNVFNACAVRALPTDCSGCVLSPELSREDIADLCSRLDDSPWLGLIVQGNIPAMITADDLLALAGGRREQGEAFGLSDATGRVFPVHPDPWGRTHILNAAELCLLDHLPALSRVGIDTFLIDARWRGARYAGEMTRIYHEAVRDPGWGEEGSPGLITPLKARIKAMAEGGITAGHYRRGLSRE